MTAVPGKPHRGALPPLTAEETALAAALERHIATIAAREHNVAHYDELEKVARYLEATLASLGYAVGRQEFPADGKPVRNIDATIEPPAATLRPRGDRRRRPLRQRARHARRQRQRQRRGGGARARAAPARPRRQSGKRIRLVLFVNEEPPYFRTEAMGSLNYARALAERNERVVAMYSLETIGFYSSEPGSQHYPAPFGLMFPDRGDFVAFVGLLGSRALLQQDDAVVPLAYRRSRASAAWRRAPCPASAGRIIGRSPSRAFRP